VAVLKPQAPEGPRGLRAARADFERRYFRELLEKNRWRVSLVAAEAGMERTHCHHKLVALGLLTPKPRASAKLRLVPPVEIPKQEDLPPTEIVERTVSVRSGVSRRIRAKLLMIKPGSDECFTVEGAKQTAHGVARAMGIKIVTEKDGKFTRIWRIM
jgi:hypothetical protein